MKTYIFTKILIITLIIMFQGCNVELNCDKQFCRNGIIVFDACTKAQTKTIIIVDDNNEAIKCQTKN